MPIAQRQGSGEPDSLEVSGYVLGPFRMDVSKRRLWKGEQLVQLSPKAFDLLVLLASDHHRILDKDELMRRLWPDTVVGEESVTQCISTLRRALGDDPAKPEYVATIPRRGYQFVGPVTESTPQSAARQVSGGTPPAPAAVEPAPQPLPATHSPLGLSRGVRWWALTALVFALASLALTAVLLRRQTGPAPQPIRFTLEPPPGTSIASGGVLSPDGRSIAFVARDDTSRTPALWIRDLNGTLPRRLAGTDGATRPFWAPDSSSLGFFSRGLLRTVSLIDGSLHTLAAVGLLPQGGTWSSQNVVVFGNRRSGLTAVSLDTGELRSVTTLDRKRDESGHRLPQFLPDGEHFLYFVNSTNPDHAGTYVSALSGDRAPRRVLPSTAEGVVYAAPGFLMYVTDGRLVAQPFDTTRLEPHGQALTLAAGVDAPLVTNATAISASTTGLLSYGGGAPQVRLNWYSDSGTKLSRIDGPVELHNPVIMADSALVLASQVLTTRRGVWAMDTRGGGSRLVTDGTRAFPSPDGQRVAFSTDASGVLDLHVREMGGTTESTLVASPYPKTVSHWTADGRYIVFASSHPQTLEDLWLLPLTSERKPTPFLQTQANEFQGEVSPDGRWIAYTSDESGRWEVYVQRFPSGGGKRAISVNGGFEPHWRRTGAGNRLFYVASNQAIMAVTLEGDRVGPAQELFKVALAHDEPTLFRNQYAVSADGRFLIDSNDGPGAPITVLVNSPHLAQSP